MCIKACRRVHVSAMCNSAQQIHIAGYCDTMTFGVGRPRRAGSHGRGHYVPTSTGHPAAMDKGRVAFARGAMKSTVAKMTGTDAAGRVVAVDAHARMLVGQATSPQRLSRMFEGWMPWL
jgi:FATC domain